MIDDNTQPWDMADDDYIDTAEAIAATLNECAYCAGPLIVLGTLGRRVHARCRNCGIGCSREQTNRTEDTDDATEQPF